MSGQKKRLTPEGWFGLADQFAAAAKIIDRYDKEQSYYVAVPHITCMAFSTEAYLKCLLTLRAKHFPPKHDLRLLFGLLPSADKRRIEALWNVRSLPNILKLGNDSPPGLTARPTTLGQCLKLSAYAFNEWRYMINDPMYWYVGTLPGDLRTRILELKPEWESSPPTPFSGDSNT